MRVHINIIKKKVKGLFIIMMEINIKEKQKIIKKKEKVHMNIKMVINMKENLRKIY